MIYKSLGSKKKITPIKCNNDSAPIQVNDVLILNIVSQTLVIYYIREKLLRCHKKWDYPSLTPHQFPLLVRTGLSIITGFFLKKNNDDGKYIHCFLPYIVIVGIEPVANSFLFFLYNSITLLFLLKSKTDSTINPNR